MDPCRIVVKAEYIKHATKKDSRHCMIADALRDQHPWAKFVVVDVQSIRFTNTDTEQRFIYLTPPRAQRALLAFDQGKTPKPFAFTMTQGHTRKMRCRMPSGKAKRAGGKKHKGPAKRYMPARFREMGIRQYGEATL